MSDIDLPWWTVPILLVLGAPGSAFAGATAGLAFAIQVSRRRRFSSGKVVCWCATALVLGAVITPAVVFLAGDAGVIRGLTLLFVAAVVASAAWFASRK